jgi:type IV secretory pathway component VirB8
MKHPSETLAKTIENQCKHIKHLDKNICIICVKHMQHPNKHTYNIHVKKQIKRDTRLQHAYTIIAILQYLDLLLQYRYETLRGYLAPSQRPRRCGGPA